MWTRTRRYDSPTFKKWQLPVNVTNAPIDLIVIERN
jgi:hypothetical protein